ncbi:hypothetical protein ACFVUS_28270 [Nocardia sp. NPDC058058]|uniref:hypothetical protein n=1 Tax=Nocardia sp. NPDC058058 TaxID=3346317 RepID=UPI0036DBEBFB
MGTSRRSLRIAHLIGIGVGLLLLIAGTARLLLVPVECAGHHMESDHVCTDTEKGHTVTRTFDQQRSLRNSTDGFLIVGGLVITTGSAVLMRRENKPAG